MGAVMAAVITSSADAAPQVGSLVPAARVQSLDGKVFDTRAPAGKITLIFYEDKDAAKHNLTFKNELGELKRSPGFKPQARIVAVADVSGYDWWPARGFVQDAVKAEERKAGQSVYLDWTGDFGKAFKAKKGASNVVLVGEDGKVQLAHEGVLSADAKDKIKAALRK
jgi:hypothetical protein